MALGDRYVDLDDLKQYMSIPNGITASDDELGDALDSASREIEDWCGRQFHDAGTTSSRVYQPEHADLVYVDDFHTTTGLTVETDEDKDGTYDTTWSSSEYQLEPLNGVVEGRSGWPFGAIRALDDKSFPTGKRATVRITAQWGWAAVPTQVLQACRIIASETANLAHTPLGVAGFGEWGAIRVKNSPVAQRKLARYVRIPIIGGDP